MWCYWLLISCCQTMHMDPTAACSCWHRSLLLLLFRIVDGHDYIHMLKPWSWESLEWPRRRKSWQCEPELSCCWCKSVGAHLVVRLVIEKLSFQSQLASSYCFCSFSSLVQTDLDQDWVHLHLAPDHCRCCSRSYPVPSCLNHLDSRPGMLLLHPAPPKRKSTSKASRWNKDRS